MWAGKHCLEGEGSKTDILGSCKDLGKMKEEMN